MSEKEREREMSEKEREREMSEKEREIEKRMSNCGVPEDQLSSLHSFQHSIET